MICKPVKRGIAEEFRKDRGQSTEPPKPTAPSKKRREATPYDSFLRKYNALEDYIDDLGTRDLVYYFREVSEENNHKYVIANIKKDMAIMKRLKDNYSNREICGMIEFLFESNQDYIDKDRISINLLASQWINTIYSDMQLWVDDKYVPKSLKEESKRKKSQHEWVNDMPDNTSVIGGKL